MEYINGGSLEDLIVPLEYGNGHDDVDRGLSPHIEDYNEAIDKQQELKSLYPELPWATRISIAQDISNGLSYLHSQGIFHRDLTSKVNFYNKNKLPSSQMLLFSPHNSISKCKFMFTECAYSKRRRLGRG